MERRRVVAKDQRKAKLMMIRPIKVETKEFLDRVRL